MTSRSRRFRERITHYSLLEERPGQDPAGAPQTPASGTDGPGLSSSSELAFWCHNCCRDWPEPFCEECGQSLPLIPQTDASTAHLAGSAAEASSNRAKG